MKNKKVKVNLKRFNNKSFVHNCILISCITVILCIINLISQLSSFNDTNVVSIKTQSDLDRYMTLGEPVKAIINTSIYFNDSFNDDELGELVYIDKGIKVKRHRTSIENNKVKNEIYYENISLGTKYVDYFYILNGTKLKLDNFNLVSSLAQYKSKYIGNDQVLEYSYIPNKIYKNITLIVSIKENKISILNVYNRKISKTKYINDAKFLMSFITVFFSSCILALLYTFLDEIINFIKSKCSISNIINICFYSLIILIHSVLLTLNIIFVHLML